MHRVSAITEYRLTLAGLLGGQPSAAEQWARISAALLHDRPTESVLASRAQAEPYSANLSAPMGVDARRRTRGVQATNQRWYGAG